MVLWCGRYAWYSVSVLGIEVLAGLTLCFARVPLFEGPTSRQGFPLRGKRVREYHSLLTNWVGHTLLYERCPYIMNGARA